MPTARANPGSFQLFRSPASPSTNRGSEPAPGSAEDLERIIAELPLAIIP
jgi:hypothetical protein